MPVRPPSLRSIAAFEAAARHASFTKAAEELNLTPGAISHAIKALEDRLGQRWAAGDAYSIADINLFPFFTWARRLEFDIRKECPKWAALFDRLKERPAVQRAVEREGITV